MLLCEIHIVFVLILAPHAGKETFNILLGDDLLAGGKGLQIILEFILHAIVFGNGIDLLCAPNGGQCAYTLLIAGVLLSAFHATLLIRLGRVFHIQQILHRLLLIQWQAFGALAERLAPVAGPEGGTCSKKRIALVMAYYMHKEEKPQIPSSVNVGTQFNCIYRN